MPMRSKPIYVLRLWYRISGMPAAQALPHPAFRWLFALVMQWTGHNNGVIEFSRRVHGAAYNLDHREVFERARQQVLETGLVTRTRIGGPNLRDQYAIAITPIQVSGVGASHVPTKRQKVGAPDVPMDAKTGASHAPSWDVSRPKNSGPYKEPRARLNRKHKSRTRRANSTAATVPAEPNTEACHDQGRVNGSHPSKHHPMASHSGSKH